jgi:hypothetical protein
MIMDEEIESGWEEREWKNSKSWNQMSQK